MQKNFASDYHHTQHLPVNTKHRFAQLLLHRLCILFVGRGSDAHRLRSDAAARQLDNALFFDEIEPGAIPGLHAQCLIGLKALDPRHKTHNIPGKFLSYMIAGLPVLASINRGNDLVDLIEKERVIPMSFQDESNYGIF